MRWLACFGAATAIALAQSGALLPNPEALKLETRVVFVQANDAGETRNAWECPLASAAQAE